MQIAQRNSLRLLQWMMAASLALPLALFVFASAVSWVSIHETADREIERSLDVAHEHALKVFETIDRSLSEIAEIIRGIPDADIVCARASAASAAEATGRLAAAGEIGLDFRREGPRARQQPGVAGRPRSIFPTGIISRPTSPATSEPISVKR